MINYDKYLQHKQSFFIKELSCKEDRVVLLVQRAEGGPFILRIYDHEIPAYRAIEGNDCPNLPKVYGCESFDGLFFVEEEYIFGSSLAELYPGVEKTVKAHAEEIMDGLCSAVSCLHDCGFIHRDIKPEHVLKSPENRIVLIDLDAAMAIRPEKRNDTQLLGTAGYAAPEQFGFSRSDKRTDIFSMGILLNELLTGVHPSVTLYEEEPIRRVIEKCTSINPQDRYQTVEEIRRDLKSAASDSGAAVFSKAGLSESSGKRVLTNRKFLISVCAALVIVVLVFVIADRQGNSADGQNSGTAAHVSSEAGPATSETDTATVEGTDYLQLYKEGRQIIYYNTRQGSQSAALFTESGEKIDQSYKVYTDRNIGYAEWDAEWENWALISNTAMPGDTGFLHAEKDGKHYAIRCLVFPEPTSLYTNVPDIDNLAKGYLESEPLPDAELENAIELTYPKGKPLTLYLVAAHGFSLDDVTCDSSRVKIQEYTGKANYPFPISVLSYKGNGKEDTITVKSQYITYIIHLTES